MRLHIEIDMDGAAFDGGTLGAVDEIRAVIDPSLFFINLDRPSQIILHDSNGNTCGRAWTTEK